MKKCISLAFAFLFFALLSATLFAQDQKKETGSCAAPVLEQEGGFTLVVFPDPQQYTNTKNYPIYSMMMNWIVENQKPLNIMNVVCVGDLVNHNADTAQWDFTSRAFAILDGKISYVPCTGNHDYGKEHTGENRESNVSKYFPLDRNKAWDGVLVEAGESALGERNIENAAYVQTAPNGQKIVILCLQFAPNDKNLAWARDFAARDEYKDAFIIVVTHDYMLPYARDNKLDENRGYQVLKEDGNTGADIWNELVSTSSNIRMVLCGHHSAVNNMADCTGFRVDKNNAGKSVYQMVFDTQALGGGWGGNGGDGWLRLLEFSADMKHVKAKTFSPFFAASPTTQKFAVDKAEYNCFDFDVD